MIDEQITLLRQLQHLVLIRDEDSRVGSREKSDELNESIEKLSAKLDAETLALYRRISSRNRIFMSPLSKGSCSACGMSIPTSIMQHVIARDRFETCTSCGRILCMPAAKATGLRPGMPDPKYLLSRFSSVKLMVPELHATTREGAIAELCDALVAEKFVTDREEVIRSAIDRENILTTAVGGGIAFPHMRGMEEGVLTFAAGISHGGIDWGGETVNLVVLTVFPLVASPFYLKLLAAFARTFEGGEKLAFVMAAADQKTLWKELNKATRVAVKNM